MQRGLNKVAIWRLKTYFLEAVNGCAGSIGAKFITLNRFLFCCDIILIVLLRFTLAAWAGFSTEQHHAAYFIFALRD
jgi:hypothetical protein